ncbi:putative membrane protein [Microbacterium keratanolyticum]|uniref:Membrane protein n=1 Tax=Microbacterium keratanolyticum TaxID=67574 RepID=A0A9W6HQ54_9MICO|nr:SHOCT domain-containing protein [Microbacterium keratanolyticum]MBM7468257.1 putative membrane protein [Microbacterium keratanolyticum]GLK00332.1 membrane protein [Microbacterium keratanolyticum]
MSFWTTIWDAIWWFLTIFVFVAYLMALFSIISDLFRDHKLNGWAKAVWMLFLVFLPFVTALVYLIARGRGMGERAQQQAAQAQEAANEYIRSVSGVAATPAAEIAHAKQLLDSGAITAEEFDKLKQSALAKA